MVGVTVDGMEEGIWLGMEVGICETDGKGVGIWLGMDEDILLGMEVGESVGGVGLAVGSLVGDAEGPKV